MNDVIAAIIKSGYGCTIGMAVVNVFMYADDILLLSPSITGLQHLIRICEHELNVLELSLNASKTVCIRIGPRYSTPCARLVTNDGHELSWVTSCRYLGVIIRNARKFECDFSKTRKAYYGSTNTVLEKLGTNNREDVMLKLLYSKCIPVATYGLDACPINSSNMHSFEFMLNRTLMRVFKTRSIAIVRECCSMFGLKSFAEMVNMKKCKFMQRYVSTDNFVCKLFDSRARAEVEQIMKLS